MVADQAKTLTDVEKPGSTPALATSRPIITTKNPAVKDPMVSAAEDQPDKPDTVRLAPSAAKKTISPLTGGVKQPSPVEGAAKKSPDEDSQEQAINDALTDQSPEEIAAAAQAVLSKEDQQHTALVDKLVAQKKYFVPIGAVQKRRTARNTALLAFVLLVLVGAILAIDAGLIQTNITLPFDLIKN